MLTRRTDMHLPWVLLAVLSPAAPVAEPKTPAPTTETVPAPPSESHGAVAQQKPKPKPKPKPDPDYCPPCGRG